MRLSSLAKTRTDRVVLAVAAAFVVAVAAGIVLRRSGVDLVAPLSAGERIVVDDLQVWRMLTSGLIVRGAVPFVQLLVLVLVSLAVIRRQGPVRWAAAAVGGHVLSAAIAYWILQVEVWKGDDAAYVAAGGHDYGISCLLAGTLGALCVDATLRWRGTRDRREGALAAFLALLAVATVPLALSWYGVEHGLSFLVGALTIALVGRRGGHGSGHDPAPGDG
jgi:hypothetical protein